MKIIHYNTKQDIGYLYSRPTYFPSYTDHDFSTSNEPQVVANSEMDNIYRRIKISVLCSAVALTLSQHLTFVFFLSNRRQQWPVFPEIIPAARSSKVRRQWQHICARVLLSLLNYD